MPKENYSILVGIMQRTFKLHPKTIEALNALKVSTIVVDSSPHNKVVEETNNIRVVHVPHSDGFFPIALLIPLFNEFLKTNTQKLFLIEGDFVLTEDNLKEAANCATNTKVLYVESDPKSKFAYSRREGLAGVLLRREVERIYNWMINQPVEVFLKYQGFADTFLWFAVSEESSGYSEYSTAGPDWIKVLHITHDDSTRVSKAQRKNMKEYRERLSDVIAIAMICNKASM